MNTVSIGFAPGRGVMMTRIAYFPGHPNQKSSL